MLHEDARTIELPTRPGGIITSPPYPGLIDYHEQHRYSYELLGLEDRRGSEIGAAANGQSRGAHASYEDDMVAVLIQRDTAGRAWRPNYHRRERLEKAVSADPGAR